MRLELETIPEIFDGDEIPILVDIEQTLSTEPVEGLTIDGLDIDIDHKTLLDFQLTVAEMATEELPKDHYRDCIHFLFALNGIWIPTMPLNDWSHDYTQEHDTKSVTTDYVGPIGFGVPNDERCLGFGDQVFIPVHCALGVETSVGVLCLQKLGSEPHYSAATFDQTLNFYSAEFAHPITRMQHTSDGKIFTWQPSAAACLK